MTMSPRQDSRPAAGTVAGTRPIFYPSTVPMPRTWTTPSPSTKRWTATPWGCTSLMYPTMSRLAPPIDQEAFRRGTSVYFADRVIPMLPEALSNGVCSLNAGTEKLTFSALMDFDNEGNMLDYRFEKAVINSKVRGVYAEVNTILDGTATQEILDKYAPVMDSLMAANELYHVFQEAARRRAQHGPFQ